MNVQVTKAWGRNTTTMSFFVRFVLVGRLIPNPGLEPGCPFGHDALNVARLPISPAGNEFVLDLRGIEPRTLAMQKRRSAS